MKGFLPLLIVALIAGSAAATDIYHYRDENGRLIVVDDPKLIPERYQATKVAEPSTRGITSPTPTFSRTEPQPQINATPITIVSNRVIVPVTLHHRNRDITVNLVLDTGANITLLDRDAVEKLRLKKWRSSTSRLANGAQVDIDLSHLDQLSVGPLKVKNLKVAVIERENPSRLSDGLLGMDVLKHRAYQIDYKNKRIVWQ